MGAGLVSGIPSGGAGIINISEGGGAHISALGV